MGYDKPEALRQAKLDYLETADELLRAPYYWAGFVQIGEEGAIDLDTGAFNWTWVWLGLGAVLFFGFGFWKGAH